MVARAGHGRSDYLERCMKIRVHMSDLHVQSPSHSVV